MAGGLESQKDEGQYRHQGPKHFCNGEDLRLFFEASTVWLEKNVAFINSLNVFPVPDGDTGINMLLTMQSALREVAACPERSASAVMEAMARGALMGARGNSGVILSQWLRGMAQSLAGKETFNAREYTEAMAQGSIAAYKGVVRPVEGTILTVVREVAEATRASVASSSDFCHLFQGIVETARHSVAQTPFLLPELMQAGVVDAGGQGLLVILEGISHFLQGRTLEVASAPEVAFQPVHIAGRGGYGYDTQFLLHGTNLKLEEVRAHITSMGDSVLVVGDSNLIRVHVHTMHPGQVLEYATALGSLTEITVENMQEQYREFLVESARPSATSEEISGVGIIAVVPGTGLRKVFESLETSAVVSGGQTMNPSTEEVLRAIEGLPAQEIIILPNHKNIILVAQQAQALSPKKVIVVPTETIPQGIRALFAFNYQAGVEANAQVMRKAAESVHTAEITTAVRSTAIDGMEIGSGEIIGFLNGELTVKGADLDTVVQEMLQQMFASDYELITVYYGESIGQAQAERLVGEIQESYPEQEIELIDGGQPYYHYILSVE